MRGMKVTAYDDVQVKGPVGIAKEPSESKRRNKQRPPKWEQVKAMLSETALAN